jgi:hypothetical protein
VAIDINSETLRTFAEAARRLPHPVHISCLHRWRLRGIRGVKLESVLLGGRRYCSDESLERFFTAVTAAAAGERLPVRTCRQRQRQIEEAEAELRHAK